MLTLGPSSAMLSVCVTVILGGRRPFFNRFLVCSECGECLPDCVCKHYEE